ncbi:MAG: sugar transferase [Deltaproteobacteria bacterium]|nr:sugar transferase [Deltaproteobacteria bacterium]MBW2737938.1 sugar transferase [Deltaproteobacteria bacterium]
MDILSKKRISFRDRFIKRSFDFLGAFFGLFLTWWIILISSVLATIDLRTTGFFVQKRIGQDGKPFSLIKLRTMRNNPSIETNVTTDKDPRITPLGRFFRKTKIDELPQLINVLFGHMSFVGPRPDVPGFADQLQGEDRVILSVRPGITGPATLKYKAEEAILAQQDDPASYNDEVIYPDKVRLNREYVENYSFWRDIKYIIQTLFSN